MNNEFYENGPEGMPRVERMTDSTIMSVYRNSAFGLLRMADTEQLISFAHAVAEETLARVPAWPAERTTAPVSLTDEAIEEIWKAIPTKEFQDGEKLELFSYAKAKRLEFARALLAAAPAPIQQGQLVEVGQMIELDDHEDPRFHTIMCDWDNEARAKLTAGTKIYAASAGSQVQAAGDDINYENLLSRYIDHVANEEGATFISSLYRDVDGSYYGMGKDVKFSADEFEALRKCSEKY